MLSQQAALLRLALLTGLVDHHAVVAWADQAIVSAHPAVTDLVSLSLTEEARWKDSLPLLQRLAVGADQGLARGQMLGLIKQRVQATMSVSDALGILKAYLESEKAQLTDDEIGSITNLDDHAHLWPLGLPDALHDLLERYAVSLDTDPKLALIRFDL